MNDYLFNEIDQLVNIDLGGRKSRHLYNAARGPRPLCLEAARAFERSAGGGRTVLIASGFPIVPEKRPETDGPPGAILTARAARELGAEPVILADELSSGVHRRLAEEIGMPGLEVLEVPADEKKSEEACSKIMDERDPYLLVSIEKPGAGGDGRYRDMSGEDASELVGKVDPLFEEARERGVPTIGIGDGGNEIGMGNVRRTVEDRIPHGGSIASSTEVDHLVVGAVSNWGTYGVLGALSALTGERLLHDGPTERSLIGACVDAGAVDGVTGGRELSVDGIPCGFHENLVEMMLYLVSGSTGTDFRASGT